MKLQLLFVRTPAPRQSFRRTCGNILNQLMRNPLLALVALASAVFAQDEPYRPAFHFTPQKNWMNDPNGMVFFEGEWHLFYQYNPHGNTWGHMSWGHAVSRDLVKWEHLPLALAEEAGVMIFSGKIGRAHV